MFKKLILLLIVAAILIGGISTGLRISTPPEIDVLNHVDILSDDFDNRIGIVDLNKPWDYWYKLLLTADEQGFYRVENLYNDVPDCVQGVCISAEEEDGVSFLRLGVIPNEFGDHKNIAQISDQRDSFAYGKQHRWFPTPGHPVIFEVVFRTSDNYKADASGTAVGNWGIMLWNGPDYFADPNANVERDNSSFSSHRNDTFLMGFTWTDNQTFGGLVSGLNAVAVDKFALIPYTNIPIRNVNINDWVNAKIVWDVNNLGVQSIIYYINDQLVGTSIPVIPFPSLKIQIYNDNERFELTNEGVKIRDIKVTEPHYLDLDRITVVQL